MIRIETTNDGTPQALLIGAEPEPERILIADLLAAYRDVRGLRTETARLRTLLHHWQRYGATMQQLVVCQAIMLYGHGSFIRHLQRTLKATEDALRAPWLIENSPTAQQRLAQNATYATERGEVAK